MLLQQFCIREIDGTGNFQVVPFFYFLSYALDVLSLLVFRYTSIAYCGSREDEVTCLFLSACLLLSGSEHDAAPSSSI